MPEPTRTEALRRLSDFVPRAGRDYARLRNFDMGAEAHSHVSRLSPYLRRRLLTEAEVLGAVLARHSAEAAEKFVQEVFWRSYWKGWLEMRPGVWMAYRAELNGAWDAVQTQSGLRARWEEACTGSTGIDCFDHWARELAATGYLHNHARMWFASIWIFTLRLPWVLGADFFLRHLLDGDPASNTLGWRWVAGLQTAGKTYLARPDNIARYTQNRFDPKGMLADVAIPLEGPPQPTPAPIPPEPVARAGLRTGLLVTGEDLQPGFVLDRAPAPVASLFAHDTGAQTPLRMSPAVTDFLDGAAEDMRARHADRLGDWGGSVAGAAAVAAWARDNGLEQIVTPHAPVGADAAMLAEVARALPEVNVVPMRRAYDGAAWPHATHGFFRFRKQIPTLLNRMAAPA